MAQGLPPMGQVCVWDWGATVQVRVTVSTAPPAPARDMSQPQNSSGRKPLMSPPLYRDGSRGSQRGSGLARRVQPRHRPGVPYSAQSVFRCRLRLLSSGSVPLTKAGSGDTRHRAPCFVGRQALHPCFGFLPRFPPEPPVLSLQPRRSGLDTLASPSP